MSTSGPSSVEGSGLAVKKGLAWASAKASERAVVLQTYSSDPKFKKYVQQVEKCLNSFDNIHEWADCISFLKQLLKTFQSYTQFKEIPRKLIVAKRLAQCLNPALPTGVHQWALEVYVHILSVLGLDGLKRDLSLWSSGLFPFFQYAATSVKPTLLNIYEASYLPLQASLRPIMKSFILALLPGLEEETGEFFDKVMALLDRLSGAVSISFFFQNIWLVMLTTPSARGTSLNFLSRRLPQPFADEDISDVVGKDIGLMIRAFAAALEDENLLVRRAALDILLQSVRVNSSTVKRAQKDDRAILMRSATGVVLRRDLSLNRRLYTWLLSADEKSEAQIHYLKTNALELLSSTLKNEMFSPSGEYAESRPFKIFISLLDKWEIGGPLTEILVYDSFKAIMQLVRDSTEGRNDLIMTASTLYEAVEPQIIWKQLLSALITGLTTDSVDTDAIRLIQFILTTFTHDEEIQSIHLPIIFAGVIDSLAAEVVSDPSKAGKAVVCEIFHLLENMLQYTSHSSLMRRPDVTDDGTRLQNPFHFACGFYKLSPTEACVSAEALMHSTPFASCFQSLVSLISVYASCLRDPHLDGSVFREPFCRILVITARLVGRLDAELDVNISWNPKHWLDDLLSTFHSMSSTFTIVDEVINTALHIYRSQYLEPKPAIHDRSVMYTMIFKLLKYLRPEYSAYHMRSVSLIWSLESSSPRSHVESILAQLMNSPEAKQNDEIYEAFGVLWRLTEDTLLPGLHFKIPMMIVLDTLKNDSPGLRRIGETWMRRSLKSYLRVLEPLLYDLLDPAIIRSPTTFKVQGRELPGFIYERSFDQRIVIHLLETLLSIINFGGQGFAKAAKTAVIRRSLYTGLIQRVSNSGLTDPEASYLDVLIECLLRYRVPLSLHAPTLTSASILQSEPKSSCIPSMQPFNMCMQSVAIDVLQAILSRGEVDAIILDSIEAITIAKLYFSIHSSRLDLQNKWLHLLHSIFSLSTSRLETSRHVAGGDQETTAEGNINREKTADPTVRYPMNPLLIQTLVEGISTQSNRAVLQHWLDFVLMAIPQFQPSLQSVVGPLNDCLCRQVLSCVADVLGMTPQSQVSADDDLASVSDSELIMLLNALERLILLSLAYTSEADPSDDELNVAERAPVENTGLLGYVSTVFSSDGNTSNQAEQLTSRSPGYRALHEGIRVLYSIWSSFIWITPQRWGPKDHTLSSIYNRTRFRCRRVLEHLFRVQSTEVFESIVDWWSRAHNLSVSFPDSAFELVDILLANSQNAVHITCESIYIRILGSTERSKKQVINSNLTESTLFRFLEQYLRRLEGPLAIQVWGRYTQLIKDLLSISREFKLYHFAALRCLGVLADKITQNTAIEDKKIKKELQDHYGKLLDSCVVYVGRSTDQGSWIRRGTKETILSTGSGRESPAPRADTLLEKQEVTIQPLESARLGSPEVIGQIISFVASSALPNLKKLLVENDKVISACNNITYYIVNPTMRGKTRPMDVDSNVIHVLQEMTRIPAALKAWRTPVLDLLNDNRIFNCTPEDANKWRPIVRAIYDSDKTALHELLAKVAAAPSTNIFTTKEYEMLLRSLSLRRLSYAIFASEKNHFLTQLPTIQERLVDVFRNVPSPVVQSEVFLCIRVLLCRLSANNLTSLWPVVLTEMYRILEHTITTMPADGSEDLQLVLAVCKCLDTLLVLQTEEFQMHQWVFITDTIDAIYRPDDWHPEAMMDLLAEIVTNLPVEESANSIHVESTVQSDSRIRKPLLGSLKRIESLRELAPFLSNVSISTFESIYANSSNIDWEAVEQSILDDMFDGR